MEFSVIVPTYNRIELLKKTLESLFRQNFKDYEVIVVNDGSSDGTHEYLSELSETSHFTYVHHANSGLAATRLAGLQHAGGEYIAFTDDDCIVPSDWLEKLHDAFQRHGIAGVGGSTVTGDPSNPYAQANDMINNYFKSAMNNAGTEVPFLTGNNVAYTRACLEKVGGPDKRFRMGAEDRDLLFRVVQAGGTMIYDPSIVVTHYNDADFAQFVKHQFEFGKGSYLYYASHSRSAKKPARIPARLYFGLFVHPFGRYRFGRALYLSFLTVLAQAAVTVGFAVAAITGTTE